VSKTAADPEAIGRAVARSQRLRREVDAKMTGVEIPKKPRRKPRRSGPRTEAGKAAVAMNAVKHGITSARVPLPTEDAAAWLKHRQGIFDTYEPVGAIEEMLANRVAELSWRLGRVMPAEDSLSATARERVPQEFRKKHGWNDVATVREAEALIEGAVEAMDALSESQSDPDRNPHRPLMPGTSDHLDQAFAHAGASAALEGAAPDDGVWTPSSIAVAITAVARHRQIPPEDLAEELIGYIEGRRLQLNDRLEFILDEQDRMRRDRILPPNLELLTLNKYELGLHRMLFQTMHELEAAQARRRGEPVPLARVQISSGG
jgi:hypothetical protein